MPAAVSRADRRNDGPPQAADHDKIAQAKREWEVTVDSLPHFVCLLDHDRRIRRANRTLESWTLGRVIEVKGREIHDVLHPGCTDPACYLAAFFHEGWHSLASGEHIECEAEDRILNRCLHVQMRATAIESLDGARPCASLAVAVLRDITDIKLANAILRSSNSELEELVRSRTGELVQTNERLRREVEERRRAEEALRVSERELRLLSAQVLSTQEQERQRIAAELHDSVGQSLSAVKFYLENTIGQGEAERAQLGAVVPRIQAAIEEVRKISMDLRPSTLDDLGILPTLAWFCREFQTIYHGIRLETRFELEEAQVSIHLKTVIYRIVQEALNNVAKHARADRVWLALVPHHGLIELEIADNGTGFDIDRVTQRRDQGRGFGLRSMRERARLSGGAFSIVSAPAQGTVLRASWLSAE